ncbi:MAG: ERF family protein [Thermoflexales bacterium]|nr:ERF family protein [Thermoflexales bacterium]
MSDLNQIALALAKAQVQFKPLIKNKEAKITSPKGSYSYKYADLAEVFLTIRQALADNEIAVVQSTHLADKGLVLITNLIHSSGQTIKSVYPLDRHPDPKAMGIELSYHRRYQLCAIVGIASDDDTDGDGYYDIKPKKKGKDEDETESKRRGLDPNLLERAIEKIKAADTADSLRLTYSDSYRLATDAGDKDAAAKLVTEYRAHKLYVAPKAKEGALT